MLSEVFGKTLNKQDAYVLDSLKDMLSHTDSISSMSYELLRSLERGKRFKEASLVDPHHRERRLYSALREIDRTFQARLVGYVSERELQINSAFSGAIRDAGDYNSSSNSSDFTTSRSTGASQQNEELEKQMDKVVDKLCHLAISPQSKPRNSPYPHGKPPWTTSRAVYTPRQSRNP